MNTKFTPVKIFIVEDDPLYVKIVRYVAEMDSECEVFVFTNGKECLDNLHLNPTIISLDYSLPDMNGEEVIKKIKAYNKEIDVIILSGQKDISVAVTLLRNGAYDYIEKGEDTKEMLIHTFQKLKSNIRLLRKVEILRDELHRKYSFKHANSDQSKALNGNSKAMQNVFRLMEKAIKNNITVSITGETGTGKEMVAKSIHYNSSFKKGNFVAVNVSAIPNELLESELFGYEKGAFTGANARKIGQFEMANEGTLFLDEIAEMDINLQAKLLRAIQEREIQRIGGNSTIPFSARIIVATHRNLSQEVVAGNFREDLYYRLLGLPIELPPLRERGNDVLILMRQFLNEFAKNNNLENYILTKAAKQKLMNYSFPGNVRELKAIIELSAVMCENNTIDENDIVFNSPKKAENFLSQEMTLKEYNNQIIQHFLNKYDSDVIKVARKLNMGKSTIYRLVNEGKLTLN